MIFLIDLCIFKVCGYCNIGSECIVQSSRLDTQKSLKCSKFYQKPKNNIRTKWFDLIFSIFEILKLWQSPWITSNFPQSTVSPYFLPFFQVQKSSSLALLSQQRPIVNVLLGIPLSSGIATLRQGFSPVNLIQPQGWYELRMSKYELAWFWPSFKDHSFHKEHIVYFLWLQNHFSLFWVVFQKEWRILILS